MFTALILITVALICAFVGSGLAGEKGRGVAGFWLGLFFGPIGIVIALLLPATKKVGNSALAAEAADLNALIGDRGKVGIGVSPVDGRTISSVTPRSSAEEQGVQVGDRIVAIDGALCEGDYRAVVLRLVGGAGSQVQVSVRRGGHLCEFLLVRR